MGDGPILDAWCPHGNSYMSLGDGPESGISMTSGDGGVFTYSSKKTNIEANSTLWLKSNAGGGIVCKGGVMMGTPKGALVTAGLIIKIWAGAGATPSLGGPKGPGGDPTMASAPCANTENNVNSANAINGLFKGASDVASGINAFRDGDVDGIMSGAQAVWNGVKGSWDMAKAANDYSGGSLISGDTADGVDGALGMVDQVMSLADGNVPNVVGFLQSGEKLKKAMAGSQGSEASANAGDGNDTEGGAPKIDARGPAGIKKLTDANMEAFAGGKIEYKAGTNIALNARNKVETCSMVFEAHANIAAAVKGLARAALESFGATKVDGRAKVTVSSVGPAKLEGKASVEIASSGPIDTKSGATTMIRAGSDIKLYCSGSIIGVSSDIKLDAPTKITGKTEIEDKLIVTGNVTAKDRLMVKGPGTFYKTLKVSGDLVGRGGVRLG